MDLYKKGKLYAADFDIEQVGTDADVSVQQVHQMLASITSRYPNSLYLDRDDLFNIGGKPSSLMADGIPYSLDGWHIHVRGSDEAAKTFLNSPRYRDFLELIQR